MLETQREAPLFDLGQYAYRSPRRLPSGASREPIYLWEEEVDGVWFHVAGAIQQESGKDRYYLRFLAPTAERATDLRPLMEPLSGVSWDQILTMGRGYLGELAYLRTSAVGHVMAHARWVARLRSLRTQGEALPRQGLHWSEFTGGKGKAWRTAGNNPAWQKNYELGGVPVVSEVMLHRFGTSSPLEPSALIQAPWGVAAWEYEDGQWSFSEEEYGDFFTFLGPFALGPLERELAISDMEVLLRESLREFLESSPELLGEGLLEESLIAPVSLA